MEQHPVPQNVTTFQFRLIGDMTIKQFGYLAGGAILAYISYKLPLPFFFTWPMTILFGLGGFGFAFVPIEERPMDVWVLSFLRNIYSPTLFTWQQNSPLKTTIHEQVARPPAASVHPAIPVQTLPPRPASGGAPAAVAAAVIGRVYTTNAQPAGGAPAQPPMTPHKNFSGPQTSPHKQQMSFVEWIQSLFSQQPHQSLTVPPAPMKHTPSIVGRTLDMSMPPVVSKTQPIAEKIIEEVKHKEEILQDKAQSLKREIETSSISEARILELQKQLTEVLTQKDKMEKEVLDLRKQMAAQTTNREPASPTITIPAGSTIQHSATPTVPKQQGAVKSKPTVNIITPEGAVNAGLPRLTTFPNVVSGITKDSDNNLLPGILITVKDKEGIPLRALKTNRLGQFAASTPLSSGTYFVEIEDPRGRFIFDRVQITFNGSIVPALEIIAKSQKQITREKLAKEIFGDTNK